MKARHATVLETVAVIVPEAAVPAYEAALQTACDTVGFFRDETTGLWQVEGVKQRGAGEGDLAIGLALAEAVTGVVAAIARQETPAGGWLARSFLSFPEQRIGRRFVLRGTHLHGPAPPGRTLLILDAGMAFGSGEHGSTRGCLRALERVAHRRPRRILELGTGSGILAMASAKLLHSKALGTDLDPWSIRVAPANAARNGLRTLTRFARADGWRSPLLRRQAPYDLVFANILARPLCLMARYLAMHLAPGGTAILAGLLDTQIRWVLAAHRPHGMRLESVLREGRWATLVLRRQA